VQGVVDGCPRRGRRKTLAMEGVGRGSSGADEVQLIRRRRARLCRAQRRLESRIQFEFLLVGNDIPSQADRDCGMIVGAQVVLDRHHGGTFMPPLRQQWPVIDLVDHEWFWACSRGRLMAGFVAVVGLGCLGAWAFT